ncbi:hypothetical protein G4V62_17035 [Bacillaceae bacterium SIJ1]|uniref:RecX family transcriptional regulator n=1 Tax=Litoribacterium kuwaitense TaxID=1398745 RepID=UPI0013EB8E46|nr:RecX family transcriptional regulator [Litoribacterium kuwaitense]NGP46567.1 hypothetical protein [Litoribacterium kuwaitense]
MLKGKHFSDEEWQNVLHGNVQKQMMTKALHLLSYRMRTEHEMVQALLKAFESSPSVFIDEVIQELKQKGYLNDAQYAEMYVQEKQRNQGKGPHLLRQELLNKGVSEFDVDQALHSYHEEKEWETARALLQKVKLDGKDSMAKAKQKMVQRLVRKGFSSSLATNAVHEFLQNDPEHEQTALHYQAEKAARKWSHLAQRAYEQKMKQTLYQKGFSFAAIQDWLNQHQKEEE